MDKPDFPELNLYFLLSSCSTALFPELFALARRHSHIHLPRIHSPRLSFSSRWSNHCWLILGKIQNNSVLIRCLHSGTRSEDSRIDSLCSIARSTRVSKNQSELKTFCHFFKVRIGKSPLTSKFLPREHEECYLVKHCNVSLFVVADNLRYFLENVNYFCLSIGYLFSNVQNVNDWQRTASDLCLNITRQTSDQVWFNERWISSQNSVNGWTVSDCSWLGRDQTLRVSVRWRPV